MQEKNENPLFICNSGRCEASVVCSTMEFKNCYFEKKKSTELKWCGVLVVSGKKNNFSVSKARMIQINKNTFILFYFSHEGLTCSSGVPYVVLFSVLVRLFLVSVSVLFLCLVLDIFFGTVTQNFPGLLGQSVSLFMWAFINFVYDDQEQFSLVFSKSFYFHVSGDQPEAVTSPCSSSQVSYVSLSTREAFSKVGRELLGAIASIHTQIISVLLDRIRETIEKVGMVSPGIYKLNNLNQTLS